MIMIVYQVKGLFSLKKRKEIRRVSDKNKRIYDNFYKRRGQSYWWKNIDGEDSNTVQEHM
jgi:hypothetical protein